MSLNVVNPKPFIKELVGKPVIVKLKFNNTSYKGVLASSDNYFNVSLTDPEEIVDGQSTKLGNDLFIRCNNVLYIRQLDESPAEEQV
ncbi:Small nuclear ribonucleoprotein F [Cyberlindnera fabianii]|uniref:Sm protein F n=1 Tax=Cyberlindnera fabianii TaxID=36022 RepID=A0A1V2LB63_CYBFA|nr:Small nuclear ribonucleoprotein F [Cyberlindnera fabianii]